MKRTIVFGDIHGCYNEWQDLLGKLAVTEQDQLVCCGDLVCKGPSTPKTLDLAMSLPNLQCVIGNHDLYLLRNWEAGCLEELTGSHAAAVLDMGERIHTYMSYIRSWPYYLELPDCIVVHAGLRPGRPLTAQDPHDLTHLRTLGDGTPWYESYYRKKTVVFGHWARKGLIVRDNAIGLDTGCVYGKKLSACVFPERKIVQVPARQVYVNTKT